jgi:hypothetical protein
MVSPLPVFPVMMARAVFAPALKMLHVMWAIQDRQYVLECVVRVSLVFVLEWMELVLGNAVTHYALILALLTANPFVLLPLLVVTAGVLSQRMYLLLLLVRQHNYVHGILLVVKLVLCPMFVKESVQTWLLLV